jgi:hypothetical protein
MTRPASDGAAAAGEGSTTAWALLAGGGAVAALAAARFLPGIAVLLPACPLRALTGLPCPTCGTTRALLALAAGHPAAAIAWNPLAVLAVLSSVGVGAWGLGRAIAPRRLPAWSPGGRETLWVRGMAVAVLLNWAYLLASYTAGQTSP